MSAQPQPSPSEQRRVSAERWAAASLATGYGLVLYRRVQRLGAARIVRAEEAPRCSRVLVLGASVRRGMTPILQDRVETAIDLHRAGRGARLVLTGSRVAATGDEVGAMARHALDLGVDAQHLELDGLGRHTFESVANAARASAEPLLIVTQRFHLPRALFLAQALGLEAWGVVADRQPYARLREFEARELFSCALAWWMTR